MLPCLNFFRCEICEVTRSVTDTQSTQLHKLSTQVFCKSSYSKIVDNISTYMINVCSLLFTRL